MAALAIHDLRNVLDRRKIPLVAKAFNLQGDNVSYPFPQNGLSTNALTSIHQQHSSAALSLRGAEGP